MDHAIGIDLGTTNSAVASLDSHGRPVIVPNGEGATTTPSVICFQEGDVLVGAEARELQAIGLWPVAAFFKRMMGNPHFLFHANGVDYTPTELSSLLLRKLKADAEVAIGEKIGYAVITVPAYFRDIERKATIEAGRTAGLDVLQVINEPTAAAIAYGAGRDGGVTGRFVVYDLGGGTFDVTLLQLGKNENRVLCSGGDHQLGGKDWDDKIIEFLADRFCDEFGVDPMDDTETLADLRSQAEAAKKRLSSVRATTLSIIHGGYRERYSLTRERFEDLTGGLLEQTILLTKDMLDEMRLSPTEVDGVLLVGGSTRMPAVRRRLEEVFGHPPRGDINEDEAVALGAGIVAADRLAASSRDSSVATLPGVVRTIDVTSHSLGVIAVSDDGSAYINSIILPKSARIPSEDTRPFRYRTRANENNRLEVFVTQGETKAPGAVAYIGKYVVSEIPHQTSGVTVIDLTYRYDRSGTVGVSASARLPGAAKRLPVTVEDLPDDLPGRFLKDPPREALDHLTAYIAIDVSGSMSGEPIRKAQEAATSFLSNTDLAHASLGVIAFATRLETTHHASQNAKAITRAIADVWDAPVGGGNAVHPFDEIRRLMSGVEGKRYAIVLTDGEWFCEDDPIKAARKCHRSDIDVIAVGFGDANSEFLRAIASTEEASFYTGMNALASTFSTIAQVLTETGGDADRVRERLGLLSAT